MLRYVHLPVRNRVSLQFAEQVEYSEAMKG